MISKAAYNKKAFVKDLVFTRSARSAWSLILKSVKKKSGWTNVLLPAYIGITEREGSGIFDPIENTNSQYGFYEINEDLSVSMESLEKLIATKKFNVLLVVHYFGYCRSDLKKIRELCNTYGVVFVEDCAHAFQLGLTTEGLGVTGDFSFYSVHKHLPVDSGGILKNISKKIELEKLPEEDSISLDSAIQLLRSDYEGIKQKRINNFRLYKRLLANTEGIDIMYDLHENEIPQTFPIRVKNGLRERLYFHLMNKDMPTIALYYRLIDGLDKENFRLAHEISNEILNLPLHQDTTEKDIAMLTDEIKYFLENKNKIGADHDGK